MITLTRAPARISAPGTTHLPSMGAAYTIGRDYVDDALRDHVLGKSSMVSVDLESCGKEGRIRFDAKAVIIGVSDHSVILDPRDPYQFEIIRRVINDTDLGLVFHNSPFDVPILYALGLIDLPALARVWDTLIWARLAEPDEKKRKTLGNAAGTHLGMEISDPLPGILKAIHISKANWYAEKDLDTPAYRTMAATDAILTHRLIKPVKDAAYRQLTTGHPFSKFGVTGDEALALVDREQIINRMWLRRTCKGFAVDPEYLDQYMDTTAVELREIEGTLTELGIRPGNAGDLTSWLEEQGLLPSNYPRTPKTKAPSGAKDKLALLGHPIAQKFVTHKEVTHIMRDYLAKVMDNADPNGRIHPGTSMLAAATGRMAVSGDAPLHQFPEGARGIILADNWRDCAPLTHKVTEQCTCPNPKGMVSIDWSQIEPVVVANIAGDVTAIAEYEAGKKFYDVIAEYSGISYKAAKTTLLAQLYGEGIDKLAADLRVTREEAENIRDLIWATLPGTKQLVDKAWKGGKLQSIAQQHKLIFTLSGRIVPIPSGWWPCWNKHEDKASILACPKCNNQGLSYSVATHKGVNYFVQGSAYDLLAETLIKVGQAGLEDALYLPMHDELVVDYEAAHDIRKLMETPPDRLVMMAKRVPIIRTDMAHLGERWAAA